MGRVPLPRPPSGGFAAGQHKRSEWLPSCIAYKLAGNYNIELYTPPRENPEDNYSEIWIPVREIQP